MNREHCDICRDQPAVVYWGEIRICEGCETLMKQDRDAVRRESTWEDAVVCSLMSTFGYVFVGAFFLQFYIVGIAGLVVFFASLFCCRISMGLVKASERRAKVT
ncbi:hypothetical protein LCGC14_1284370 [marine sediment metagenome]|uniref:Uncharacterized protein n=1 Tax=marine sediment metagenome TaxID=412755 RepID=A0A0F9LFA9_9ZZZZ